MPRVRTIGVMHPIWRTPRSVTQSQPLRDDPLQTHLAGVLEHDGALRVFQVLIQAHTRSAVAKDARQRGLTNLNRLSDLRREAMALRRGRKGSMKLARSAPAPSYALEFAGRWDRCIQRLWVRDDHSNAG